MLISMVYIVVLLYMHFSSLSTFYLGEVSYSLSSNFLLMLIFTVSAFYLQAYIKETTLILQWI